MPTGTASPAQPAASPPAETSGTRLSIRTTAEHGAFLTDAAERAVYLLEAGSVGECVEMCAAIWPPVLARGVPTAADTAVRTSLLGTVTRRDGATARRRSRTAANPFTTTSATPRPDRRAACGTGTRGVNGTS